jgi:hypothetical protein
MGLLKALVFRPEKWLGILIGRIWISVDHGMPSVLVL